MAKIIGATNIVYIGKSPARTVQMVAKKGLLSSTWNLYTIRERPMMPTCGGRIEYPPIQKKIASGLSLSEVFNRMQAHEDPGARLGKASSEKSENEASSISNENTGDDIKDKVPGFIKRLLPTISETRDIPADDPRYWRNVQKKLGL